MATDRIPQAKPGKTIIPTPSGSSLFQPQGFADPQQEEVQLSGQAPSLQTQMERASRLGHNFANIQILSHPPEVQHQAAPESETDKEAISTEPDLRDFGGGAAGTSNNQGPLLQSKPAEIQPQETSSDPAPPSIRSSYKHEFPAFDIIPKKLQLKASVSIRPRARDSEVPRDFLEGPRLRTEFSDLFSKTTVKARLARINILTPEEFRFELGNGFYLTFMVMTDLGTFKVSREPSGTPGEPKISTALEIISLKARGGINYTPNPQTSLHVADVEMSLTYQEDLAKQVKDQLTKRMAARGATAVAGQAAKRSAGGLLMRGGSFLLKRVVPKAIPGVGWALLAYDVYSVGKWAVDSFSNSATPEEETANGNQAAKGPTETELHVAKSGSQLSEGGYLYIFTQEDLSTISGQYEGKQLSFKDPDSGKWVVLLVQSPQAIDVEGRPGVVFELIPTATINGEVDL